MRVGVVVAAVAAAAALATTGCSGSGGTNDLDRIDGPARVDPDYRPLEEGSAPGPAADDGPDAGPRSTVGG